MLKRFRFVKDDDGHTYLIPANKHKAFTNWMDAGPYWEGYTGEDFSQYEIGTSYVWYTFTDPKLDKD